jgi:YegS/Rv2252/BmrU family lipid kinase
MVSPFGQLVIIANARSRSGRAGLAAAGRVLDQDGLEYRVVLTTGPGHATRAAAEALADGVRYLVAAGGDGTVHEVLNGMLSGGGPVDGAMGGAIDGAVLGVLPIGSGCDFVRSFGIPRDPARAAGRLSGDATHVIDVGKVTYGGDQVRYFANIAEAGLGGAVVARAARLPGMRGGLRYGVAFCLALPRFRPGQARVTADGTEVATRMLNVVVANCQYYGGGMRISPKSTADDGLLDLLTMTGSRRDAWTTLPKVYRGRHLPHPEITELRGSVIRVEAEVPLLIEADGELIGSTPATFEAVPSALRLKV